MLPPCTGAIHRHDQSRIVAATRAEHAFAPLKLSKNYSLHVLAGSRWDSGARRTCFPHVLASWRDVTKIVHCSPSAGGIQTLEANITSAPDAQRSETPHFATKARPMYCNLPWIALTRRYRHAGVTEVARSDDHSSLHHARSGIGGQDC